MLCEADQTIVDWELDWSRLYWRTERCVMQLPPDKKLKYIEYVGAMSLTDLHARDIPEERDFT